MFSRFIIFYYLYVKLCWILLDIYGKNRTNFYYILHKKNYDQNVSFNKKCSQVVGASSFTGSVQTYSAFVLGVSRVRGLV